MRNRGIEASLEGLMATPIPEDMREVARALGLSAGATMSEFADHMRVQTHRAHPDELADFLDQFEGWDIEWESDEAFGHGDRIGTIRVAGKKTPIFAHMGLTELFDRTDPPLEKLFAKAAKGRKKAIVLQVLPRFYIDANADGEMRHVLFQGGWYYEGEIWTPFLLTQAGPDDVVAQRRLLKPGAPSRGLLRERGQDPKVLQAAHDFHRSLINRLDALGEDSVAAGSEDDQNARVATSPTGWSFFGNDRAFDAHKRLMSSLTVPLGSSEDKPSGEDTVGGPGDARLADEDFDERIALEKLEAFLDDAPEGIVEAVGRMAETPEQKRSMLAHMAILTGGFEGLDDASCADLSEWEVFSLVRCGAAAFSAGQLAYWLHEIMGWDFEWVSGTDPEEAEEGEEDLTRHGDVFALLNTGEGEEPVPVMFHGGRIDPVNAAEDFAFMTTRRAAVRRSGGKPILVMPAVLNMCTPPDEPTLEEGGGLDRLLIMAGYAFDGVDWAPVSFGRPGSNPMANKLVGDDLLPEGEDGYTGKVTLPCGDCTEGSERPPLSLVFMMQQTLDRYHDLGPEIEVPRAFENPQEDFKLMTQDGSWFWFGDRMQEEVYPEA